MAAFHGQTLLDQAEYVNEANIWAFHPSTTTRDERAEILAYQIRVLSF